jgi:hypothetical protein
VRGVHAHAPLSLLPQLDRHINTSAHKRGHPRLWADFQVRCHPAPPPPPDPAKLAEQAKRDEEARRAEEALQAKWAEQEAERTRYCADRMAAHKAAALKALAEREAPRPATSPGRCA